MTYWQAWIACGLLMTLPATAQADIYRWDNRELIPGTEGITLEPGVDLSSYAGEWSNPERNLRFAGFSGALLTEANFSGSWLDNSLFSFANLTNASFESAILTNADLSGTNLTDATIFSGAVVAGADFGRVFVPFGGIAGSGITLPQLYSTASYQQKNLRGIGLSSNDLTGGDFSGQDLAGADLGYSTLTSANLAGAMVSGANFGNTASQGFTKEQLYSTASYQQRNLRRIGLGGNDLTGWDFSGQDLTGANFSYSTLTNANLAGAIVKGAVLLSTWGSFTKEQLYSTASYQQRDLNGINLSENNLTGWDFSGQDLTGANFSYSTLTNANLAGANLTNAALGGATLTNANLAGAMVTGANIGHATGFTKEQLYSTASYQQKDLRGIDLRGSDLTGGDFSGQDLAGADFAGSTLTNANFSFADLRRAQMSSGPLQLARNTIREFGAINGLDLQAGETLIVRDSDMYITVNYSMNAVSGGTLKIVFDADAWRSTVSFEPAIPVTLDGTLELTFADNMDIASQIGRTFDLFDWTGVTPTGAFAISSPYAWDLSNLYTTGEVTFTAIPEPSTVLLFACGTAACALARLRVLANRRGLW